MSIQVLGTERTLAQMAAFLAAGMACAELAEDQTKSEVAEAARGMVAVDTGETQSSIEETHEGVEAAGAAIYLEFGTYKMAAQPFMRPAAEEVDESSVAVAAEAAF